MSPPVCRDYGLEIAEGATLGYRRAADMKLIINDQSMMSPWQTFHSLLHKAGGSCRCCEGSQSTWSWVTSCLAIGFLFYV